MARFASVAGLEPARTRTLLQWIGPLRLIAVLLLSACFLAGSLPAVSLAQVITNIRPDLSLLVPTHVDLNAVLDPTIEHHISMGEIRGNAWFHSFETFSLGTGEAARFLDPGVGIEFIFSRVTDVDMMNAFPGSTIDGMLISDIPGADFYFMNPLGIIFGANASLDIGTNAGAPGSFYATTANYMELAGGFQFNALPEPLPDPLPPLSMPPVTAFGFVGLPAPTPASIEVQGTFLDIPFAPFDADTSTFVGKTLALVGGEITIGPDPATLNPAFVHVGSGNLELVSLASPGRVLASSSGGAPEIESGTRGPIAISGSELGPTLLDASDLFLGADGRGGTVVIRGGVLMVDNSFLNSATNGDTDGAVNGIDINVTSMSVTGGASIAAGAFDSGGVFVGTGKAGRVVITADTMSVSGRDPSGTIASNILSSSQTAATSGQLVINGGTLDVSDGAVIETGISGLGQAENLTINVETLNVLTGGRIGTFTNSSAKAGNAVVTVTGPNSLLLSGEDATGRSAIRSVSEGSGATGDITVFVTQGDATVADGARIGGDLTLASQAGTITVDVAGTLRLAGRDSGNLSSGEPFPSAILNVSASGAQSGDVNVKAGTLILQDGALIQSLSAETGQGGSVKIEGKTAVSLSGDAQISSIAAQKDVGNVIVSTPSLVLNDAAITATTEGAGNAGNVVVKVGTATLSNGATIASSSTATATGNAGSVTIEGMTSPANAVTLTNSSLETSAANTGQGGSITVEATNLMLNDSTISASVKDFQVIDPPPDPPTDGPDMGLANIDLTASTMTMTGGTVTAETSGSRNAGTVTITTTGNTLTLSNNAEIASSSTGTASGSGQAGSVTIDAGSQFVSQNSKVTVGTEQADGGDITLNATTLIQLTDSQITATVKGGQGQGGNISIDPNFVILENSSITANAFGGPGGNINIVAGTFLMDPASSVTASSAFSAQGTVNINAPVQNISTSLAPLPKNFASAAALLAERCAARAQDARFSTFVLAGRDGVPPEPGGVLPSPLIAADLSGPAAPTATGAIHDHAGAASVSSSSSASFGSGRIAFALADDACGK